MPQTPTGQGLVLQEFQLNAADSAPQVAEIVAQPRAGGGAAASGVPLLVSVDDPRDVATLRTVADQDSKDADRGERAALAPFVASWRPLKRYEPRVAESGREPPSYYRMAVTESGINDGATDTTLPPPPEAAGAAAPIGSLWIGAPVGTHAGLLVLVGHYGAAPVALDQETAGWPLPLSRELGVRIYEGAASNIQHSGKGAEVETDQI